MKKEAKEIVFSSKLPISLANLTRQFYSNTPIFSTLVLSTVVILCKIQYVSKYHDKGDSNCNEKIFIMQANNSQKVMT